MTYTNITLFLEYGSYNGLMDVTINNQKVTSTEVSLELVLPAQLIINVSGKNYNCDTLVSNDGRVIDDKYVKLVELRIGGIPVEEVNLFKIIKYQTDQGRLLNDAYWGFNGTITVDIDQENFIKYLLLLDNKFTLTA